MLVGNCDSLLFLGGSDATTLEYVSKKLGKETIRAINTSRSYGRQGSNSMSYNKTGRELMTPDELSNMDNNNCVLFIRGLYPFFGVKYPLERHPNYPYSGDGNSAYEYNVAKKLRTGANPSAARFRENPARRIYTEAQISDTRESDRQHKIHSRNVETRSYNGRPLMKSAPLTKTIPGINKSPEERTEEEQIQYEQTMLNMNVEEINLNAENFNSLQEELASMYAPEEYGTSELAPEEEERGEG